MCDGSSVLRAAVLGGSLVSVFVIKLSECLSALGACFREFYLDLIITILLVAVQTPQSESIKFESVPCDLAVMARDAKVALHKLKPQIRVMST